MGLFGREVYPERSRREPSRSTALAEVRGSHEVEQSSLHCYIKPSTIVGGFFVFEIIFQDTQLYYGMILPYCVYVLQSEKDLLLYHGYTTNLHNRIINHNRGGTKSTSRRRPLKLIYCEFFLSKKDAKRREMYFKTSQGKRMLKLVLKRTLKEINYPKRKT
ncbi:GIY-YIG nuclease family protein [Poritiphilus flavus]|nr:GIY-YIG nuclease family protein [Poritiphilus flavus]